MSGFYAIIAHDRPGATATRMDRLEEHLTHIEARLDRFAVAGPLRDAQGNVTGSLLVVKAESEADARALLVQDPYYTAQIWSGFEIREFNAAAGDWVGGRNW